jgi:hypothetical protein
MTVSLEEYRRLRQERAAAERGDANDRADAGAEELVDQDGEINWPVFWKTLDARVWTIVDMALAERTIKLTSEAQDAMKEEFEAAIKTQIGRVRSSSSRDNDDAGGNAGA